MLVSNMPRSEAKGVCMVGVGTKITEKGLALSPKRESKFPNWE